MLRDYFIIKFNPSATTIPFQLSFGACLETLLVRAVELLPSFRNLGLYPNRREKRGLGVKNTIFIGVF